MLCGWLYIVIITFWVCFIMLSGREDPVECAGLLAVTRAQHPVVVAAAAAVACVDAKAQVATPCFFPSATRLLLMELIDLWQLLLPV
jgi:hypothetical protein